MPAPASSYAMAMPVSPPPPQSLSTYSRSMHDHTKRQMESFGAVAPPRSSGSTSASSSLTNGVAPAEYQP
ncbi:Uncharacterized protein TCAP_05799 [Tolypocladium capitatum]|uniref:Uncharacterized protein n=1 Tax=Tolypocladium capitatum TaxID=45235 RepID=A0A2K3Q9W0_9HYPO|nr:Uncharacterized protein TCAP_05799 [Tolypocladium capitatum]